VVLAVVVHLKKLPQELAAQVQLIKVMQAAMVLFQLLFILAAAVAVLALWEQTVLQVRLETVAQELQLALLAHP
jgi:hypothetical protein